MSRSLALQSFAPAYKAKTRQNHSEIQPWKTWLSYGLISLSVFLLMGYLFGVNDYASTGYEIKTIQNKISALTEENKKLSLRVSEQNSLATVNNELANSQFVPVAQVKFLQVTQLTIR